MRLRIDLAYDGTDFHGWATQPGLRTVQGSLEDALAVVLRVPVPTTCAGRTDTGVHARGQVVHADVPGNVEVERLSRRLNGVLPADVRVHRVAVAADGFDARFSALWRRYVYRIADREDVVDPLTRGQVLAWGRELDVDAMYLAATQLLGEHDFAAFCKRREGATTVRTLLDLLPERMPSGVVEVTVRADAFCHNMVRSLVGGLIAVGERRESPLWLGAVLDAGVRHPGVTVLPPHGLTLEEVAYPSDEELGRQASAARVMRVVRAIDEASVGDDGRNDAGDDAGDD